MKKITLRDRLRYAFDNLMARGTVAQIAVLALFTIIAVILFSVIVWFTDIAAEANLLEQIWSYLSLTIEADPLTGEPWLLRVSTLIITLVAVFITSILIGLLAAGIEEKISDLRKGRSRVIESGHTVILGWTPAVFTIVSELAIANQNLRKATIVILGQKDKVEMEDEIRDKLELPKNLKVVCRTGNPMDTVDLDIVSLNTSRSILILGLEEGDPDAGVIKTLLAITHNPDRREAPYHIVAEIEKRENFGAAQIAGRGEVELVLPGEMIARITAQTSRQSGLSVAYVELLDFGGDEIYYQTEPSLTGRTFGEVLLAYEDSSVIGLLPKEGTPKLNPPMDTIIEDGDQIIAISEDDDTVVLSGKTSYAINEKAIRSEKKGKPSKENILILGWNWRALIIIRELDNYVAKGSKITVLASAEGAGDQIAAYCQGLKNITVDFKFGDTTNRQTLEALPFKDHHNIILLSYSGYLNPQQADARTLITLLHLRDIKEKQGYLFSIVSEILDVRNQSLAEITQVDDFVISDRLISLMLAQISENKHLGAVFEDILDSDGSEIYIKPVSDFVEPCVPLNFYTVVEAARRQNQVAIGFRVHSLCKDPDFSYGVVLNPKKSIELEFMEEDQIIVISEE
jgi:voltage-gated potassium channel Kch